jgi:RHS repeat-associated protein
MRTKVWDTSYFRNPIVHDLARQVVPAIQGPFGIGMTEHFGRIYRDQRYVDGCDSGVNYSPCFTSTWYWVTPDGTSHVIFYDPDLRYPGESFPSETQNVEIGPNGASGNNLPLFTGRLTDDLSYARVYGPSDAYCIGTKDDGIPETGCFEVKTGDGLAYTLVKRVDCVVPPKPTDPDPAPPLPDYQKVRSDNQSFCGWYTTLIEDESVGSRGTDSQGRTTPYPIHVTISYDTRANFQHAVASVTDSAGRDIIFHNCEWGTGANPPNGHCSQQTTRSCTLDGQCLNNDTCLTEDIAEMCVPGSKDPGWAATERSAVATYAVDMPAFGNDPSALNPATRATYGFRYEYTPSLKPDFDYDGQMQSADPVLKLVRIDYPPHQRPGQAGSDEYSLYLGYYNINSTNFAYGGGGDYGEVTCRSMPLLRTENGQPQIIGSGCSGSGAWARTTYDYAYYEYIAAWLTGGRAGAKKKTDGGGSGGFATTGMTRQVVKKRIELPAGSGSTGAWTYRRQITSASNPDKVTVTDPFGNDTLYYYHASSSSPDPAVSGSDPEDGFAPEWSDGLNFQVDYYEGDSESGQLKRSVLQEYDSDSISYNGGATQHSKSNTRVRRTTTQYLDDGGVESIVSKDAWDGFGHWDVEVDSGFDAVASQITPRITRREYRNPATVNGVYRTDLLLYEEITDGHHLFSRTENEYDASSGRLLASIGRLILPSRIGTRPPASGLAATQQPGDVLTTYTYSQASGNIIGKSLSTGRSSDPTYDIKYTWGPATGGCTTQGECGGYLASKSFLDGSTAPFKSIDRDRDANTGLILATRDTAGVQTDYSYDLLGRVTEVRPAGEDPTSIDYVSLNKTTVTRGTPGSSDLDVQADFEFARYMYDGLGRLTVTEGRPADPSRGFTCQKTQYDLVNHVLYKTEVGYADANGCQPLQEPPQEQCWAAIADRQAEPGTEFDMRDPDTGRCDPFGRVRFVIPPDGTKPDNKVTRTDYFGTSDQVTVYSVMGPGNTQLGPTTTAYLKDALGRLRVVDAPMGEGGRCSIGGTSCTSSLDCASTGDRCVSTNGGADATYEYDVADRLIRVDLTDDFDQTQTRRFDYDGLGHLLWEEHPESGTRSFLAYDALGHLLSQQDARGNVSRYYFDFAGRPYYTTVAPAGSVYEIEQSENSYDETDAGQYSLGKLTRIQSNDADGRLLLEERRYYDGLGGRLSELTHAFTEWAPGTVETTTYEYDARGQVTFVGYPVESGSQRTALQVRYGYANGSVISVSEDGGGVLGQVTYNAAGAVDNLETPGGGRTIVTYDNRNRPLSIDAGAWENGAWRNGAAAYASGTYAYDGAGNIFQIGANRYGYDAANRLVSARSVFPGDSQAAPETYDQAFVYDIYGNIVQSQLTPFSTQVLESEDYTYGSENTNRIGMRQSSIGSSTPSAVSYLYDPNGNLIQGGRRYSPDPSATKEDIKKYDYDPLDRLVRIQDVDDGSGGTGGVSEVDRFDYDAAGDRIGKLKNDAGIKTYYLRDPSGRVLSEFRTLWTNTWIPEWAGDYVYLGDRMLALRENLVPAPPTGLSATAAAKGPEWNITLTWDPSDAYDFSHYRVFRWRSGIDTAFQEVAQVTDTTYADPDSFPGGLEVHYYLTVVDTPTGYESSPSEDKGVLTGDTTGPPAPTLSAVPGDGRVTLSWTWSSDIPSIVGYQVERRLSTANNVPSLPITTQLVQGLTFVDLNLQNGQTYYYRVRAKDAAGNWGPLSCRAKGPYCDVDSTPRDLAPPSAPQNPTVSTSCHNDGTAETLTLTWDPNPTNQGVTSYNVYRSTAPLFNQYSYPVATVTGASYEDSLPSTPGVTYYYAVQANDGKIPPNVSPFSEVVVGQTRDASLTPAVQLTAQGHDGEVTVSWRPALDAVTPNPAPAEYRVYRRPAVSESCDDYQQVGSKPYASTDRDRTITDSSVRNNAAYEYAVVAVVDNVESGFSPSALGIPLARPEHVTQCQTGMPFGGTSRSDVVSWKHASTRFYQPLLADNTGDDLAYLKGYHFYQNKVSFVQIPAQNCSFCYAIFVDQSTIRPMVFNPGDPADPYLIDRRGVAVEDHPYLDPRAVVDQDAVFSSVQDGTVVDSNPFYPPSGYPGCGMPRAVYKVYAKGTWLTAETDWPHYFDPLKPLPYERCTEYLQDPFQSTSVFPACNDPDDPNFVPPPSFVGVTSDGAGGFQLRWKPPVIAPGHPQVAGYYLYGWRHYPADPGEIKAPLPFAFAGPGETSATLSGVTTGTASGLSSESFSFAVASVDDAGHVSLEKGSACEETGTSCSGYNCSTLICSVTRKSCLTDADCASIGTCGWSKTICSATQPCQPYVCQDSPGTSCDPTFRVQSQSIGAANQQSATITAVLPQPPGNGDGLVAVIGTNGTTTGRVSSIVQSGASWSRVNEIANNKGITAEIWLAQGVQNAGKTITINLASTADAYAVVSEYRGMLTSGSLDATQSAKGKGADAATGTIAQTTFADEIWVGGVFAKGNASWGTPTNDFTKILSGNQAVGGYAVADKIVSQTGAAGTSIPTGVAGPDWAGVIAAFRAVHNVCPGGSKCAPQGCSSESLETCQLEPCNQHVIGRWCAAHPDVACTSSSDCPNWQEGRCTASGAACDPDAANCPLTGEICEPGERCQSVYNYATASSSAASSPKPPASLRTILWTVNDLIVGRGRNGIKLGWNASPTSTITGFRVYRSRSPQGPYCALLTGTPSAPPLPQEVVGICDSDVPDRSAADDGASIEYSVTASGAPYYYWDRTVEPDQIYYYRVSQVESSGSAALETPFAATFMTSGRQLPYDATEPPPPQGFRAWAPHQGPDSDKEGIALSWCPIWDPSGGNLCSTPTPDLPTITQYRIYRQQPAVMAYKLLAKISPQCLAPGQVCEITPADTCYDFVNYTPHPECQPIQPSGVACGGTGQPRCGVIDRTFDCYPQTFLTASHQQWFDYVYYVTAVGQTCSGPEVESVPSNENQGWLNYCAINPNEDYLYANCHTTGWGCTVRSDPDGDGEFPVCGDENVRLHTAPDDPANVSPAIAAARPDRIAPPPLGEMAPHRTVGQSNPYNPPARFLFYHVDHLGSPRVILDKWGNVVSLHHYLPFGTERPLHPEDSLNVRHFTGHERDKETGLDYMLARYYSSGISRFVSPDSGNDTFLVQTQSWNRFSYTRNNPLTHSDPLGTTSAIDVATAAGIAGQPNYSSGVGCKGDEAGCRTARSKLEKIIAEHEKQASAKQMIRKMKRQLESGQDIIPSEGYLYITQLIEAVSGGVEDIYNLIISVFGGQRLIVPDPEQMDKWMKEAGTGAKAVGVIGTFEDAQALFDRGRGPNEPVPIGTKYGPGWIANGKNGGVVTLRESSKSGTPAVDTNMKEEGGGILTVHFNPGQPQ